MACMPDMSIIAKTGDMFQSGREVEERRCDFVTVLVLVDTTAPASLVIPIRDAFDPRLPTSEVRVVDVCADVDLLAPTQPDVCVAIMGRDATSISWGVCELAAAGVPVALVVESALDAPTLPLGRTAASRVSVISAIDEEVLLDRLAEWLVGATGKSIAFAANFPFCRKAKVRELVNEQAMEMAVNRAKMGPGGDLPSMTVSQARLALTIAAINGQPLALGRVPEVLTAVGAGFGSRMFANKALGKIPIVGWLFQAGFGYLGTQATGRSLQHRFDKREMKAAAQAGASNAPRMAAPAKGAGRQLPSGGQAPSKAAAAGMSRPAVTSTDARPSRPAGRPAQRRKGDVVRSGPAGEVRLLPGSEDGGFLVYEREDVR